MDIQVSTVLNYDTFKEYFRFTLFRGKRYIYKAVISLGIMLVAIGISLYGTITYFDENPLMLFALIFSVLMTILLLFIWFFMPKYSYAQSIVLKGSKDDYLFELDKFKVTSVTENITGIFEIKYVSLYKVYETKDFFYMFMNYNTSYIINKSSFDNSNNVSKLRNIFISSIPEKFVNCI